MIGCGRLVGWLDGWMVGKVVGCFLTWGRGGVVATPKSH